MQKKLIAVFIFIALVVLSFGVLRTKKAANLKTIPYRIGNKEYSLLTATNSAEWEKGLMYVRRLDNVDGMIFIFPVKSIKNFWNKNTYMDLDIYWLDDDRVTGKSFLPSIEKSREIVVVQSSYPVNKVVEIPSKKK